MRAADTGSAEVCGDPKRGHRASTQFVAHPLNHFPLNPCGPDCSQIVADRATCKLVSPSTG